ncbi:hypothetical protein JTB14_005830 [Gonioctena quinquepunctata]|nr:hypothetical protein JTB14_005830 [Gonioctena quinquepunctata]
MFDENGMRKGTKSTLYKRFKPLPDYVFPQETVYVVDGGFLLHREVWREDKTYEEICDTYIDYVRHHYKNTATFVFDGYDEAKKSTKVAERIRRATKCESVLL